MTAIKKPERKKNDYSSTVPAVEQSVNILMHLASAPGVRVSLTEISRKAGITHSKAYALLNTLQKFRLVTRDAEGKLYSLGAGLVSLGQRALENLNYRETAQPVLDMLARETRCTSQFAVISGENIIVAALKESREEVSAYAQLGHVMPLFRRALGKAIAAGMTEEERERIIDGKNELFNESHPEFHPDTLRKELDFCRRRGYIFDISPYNPLIKYLIAPVIGPAGSSIGCLFAIGIFRKPMAAKYGALVAGAARKLSESLGGTWMVQ